MKDETGDVDGGLVIIPEISRMMYCPFVTPEADNGLENLIRYPAPSSVTNEHGVVVVVGLLTALLQLLVNTAVFKMIGLGMNKFKVPPMSISFSMVSLTVEVTPVSNTLGELG